MGTTVRITNTYADRETTVVVLVPSPADAHPNTVADWWDDVVFPETGGGGGGDAVYSAHIEDSDIPGLTGQDTEWMG